MALGVLNPNCGTTVPVRPGTEKPTQMLGWMMVFAFIAILAGTLTITAGPAAGLISTKFATLVFSALFLVCLLTSLIRGRA
jgi:uncharacterized membrane protein YtjA (UPF0391 family)